MNVDTSQTLHSLKAVEATLSRQIERFNERRGKTRWWRNLLFNAQVLSAALTTLLTAANIKFGVDLINLLAVGTSVATTTLGVFLTRYMFHERLETFTQTSASLQALLGELRLLQAQHADDPTTFPITAETMGAFYTRVNATLGVANEKWSSLMLSNKPTEKIDAIDKGTHV